MSLRTKILALFLALMLIPMLVVSVGNYVQSMRSLRSLIEAKLDAAGERAAMAIAMRERESRSLLARFAEASYAGPIYGEPVGGRPGSGLVRPDIGILGPSFESVEFRDERGRPLEAAASFSGGEGRPASCAEASAPPVEIRVPVLLEGDAVPRGEIVGRLRVSSVIPEEALRSWFGRNGQQLVVDRETGTVVFDARCAGGFGSSLRAPVADWEWVATGAGRGRVVLLEDGIEKTGAFVEIASLPLLVVTVADMEEFAGPYGREQLLYLLFVMFIVAAAGGAFLILAQETMGSLEELTVAAERIGEGELTPWLPPPGPDEVGRLSQAFSLMLGRLKVMMRQNEVARRLAVAGEVTAQLSHEIRNPLSSIRLNLQSLERETRADSVPSDLPQVLRLCLREIDRLDEAVGSVLEVGQPKPPEFRPCGVNAVVAESIRILAPRFQARVIDVAFANRTECDRVLGDEGQLRGVFLNLFLNAIDAMPAGGELRVWTSCDPDGTGGIETRVHVQDSGQGIRPEIRHLIFEPFFTTKAGGSGIGLTVAVQTVAAHGGRLCLEENGNGPGAHFVVVLPAAPAEGATRDATVVRQESIARSRPWRPAPTGAERTGA